MANLDYFLKKNWNTNKLLDGNESNLYFSKIPSFSAYKFNFNFKNRINNDHFLYDYSLAFKINSDSKTIKEIQMLEILSLLELDGNLEEKNVLVNIKRIKEIYDGRKPSGKDEKKIWNLIEVLNLIKVEGFNINENNFELIIHIIFRNLGFDLDSKNSYYRNEKDKSIFKGLVETSLIDKELNYLFENIQTLSKNDIQGFTSAYLLLVNFIFISPYKEFNILIAFLLSKWFLVKMELEYEHLTPINHLGINWKNFVTLLNKSLTSDFNLDELFVFLDSSLKSKVNYLYRFDLLNNLFLENKKIPKSIFPNIICKAFIVNVLSYKNNSWKIEKIKSSFNYKNQVIFTDLQLESYLNFLVESKILKTISKNNIKNYAFADSDFEKIRRLLKD
ncbi:hypothetical protein ESOMN_v1c06800 [Williamsoniiplasma somnilux]|uniref:Fido domain-containing protein n=1 Tax=Williamsoniiplasma somnilux TaxID=215578 RepID=A0A2K8NZ14_9MOLU|nr:hypothetical protein [Williamsoniiplasma somnilux]ATZ19062.1 hypothetical protein ESOMN_v1c06800 [Williamsoniiplasma somnilux]